MNQKDIKDLQATGMKMADLIRKLTPTIIESIKKASPEELKDFEAEGLDLNLNKHVANLNKDMDNLNESLKNINGNIPK